jgi:phospholipase C
MKIGLAAGMAALALCLAACSDRGGGSGTSSNVAHVVVLIQENTSFDAYFATWCAAPTGSDPSCTSGTACCEAGPATDPGTGVLPLLLDDTQHAAYDPIHFQVCMIDEINGGKMDRYVDGRCGNRQNFAYADDSSVGFYRDLAARSALADRWFQPVVGASSANDMYFARANFVFPDNTYVPDSIGAGCTLNKNKITYDDQTVGDLLADAGVSWAFYIQGYQEMIDAVQAGSCPPPDPACPGGFPIYPCVYDPSDIPFQYYPRFRDNPTYMRDFSRLRQDLAGNDLPSVVFVKALGFRSEHPGYGDTISDGIAFTDDLITVTYDESGGYFDHVSPPPTSAVDDKDYGPRVPTFAIGRFARAGTVSHVELEHSSIVKFLEWNWLGEQTGQLGTRDAVVHNIGSLLDPAETGTVVPD